MLAKARLLLCLRSAKLSNERQNRRVASDFHGGKHTPTRHSLVPSVTPPQMEAEAPPELIPEGFDYYAAGHIHVPYKEKFKDGILVYSGCTEAVNYNDAKVEKGFYYVKVNERGVPSPQFIKLESPRKFKVLEQDFTGVAPSKITELAVQLVKGADESEAVIIPVLKGVLPVEASRAEVDVAKVRGANEGFRILLADFL